MPSSLSHPLLLSGACLVVGLPVLIHLINMMRHRRVRWAAMEFLLVSQKKHRTWILFKQLLLLLLRMAAVPLLVLAVAQPVLNSELGACWAAARPTTSCSWTTASRCPTIWDDTSAFAQAKAVVGRIAARPARQVQPQTFTLLRFSQAGRPAAGPAPISLKQRSDADFPPLAGTAGRPSPSQTAAEPGRCRRWRPSAQTSAHADSTSAGDLPGLRLPRAAVGRAGRAGTPPAPARRARGPRST